MYSLTIILFLIQLLTVQGTFNLYYQWSYVNFTWPTQQKYQHAIKTKQYIPENVAIAGIKLYGEHIFYALPRFRNGTPVTLAMTTKTTYTQKNKLLEPYPSWHFNVQKSCSTLQNVQSMEIDPNGIMWVIDGTRINSLTKCPPKLVLFDLKQKGKVIYTYTFTEDIVNSQGGYLNDIVLDGDCAYITENSQMDPGLIIFCKSTEKVWKLRDPTMFSIRNGVNITSGGFTSLQRSPINGIALSPYLNKTVDKLIYYCPLSSRNLYAISTKIAKNYDYYRNGTWRSFVREIGEKQSESAGLMMDKNGELYYTLLQMNAIAKWKIYDKFIVTNTARIIYTNKTDLEWPDSFGMDTSGYLYILATNMNKFGNPAYEMKLTDTPKIRIFRRNIGSKSYMY